MDFLQLAEDRYSVRGFADRPVEEEKLAKILRAAQLAPTGCNDQPQHIFVLESEEALAKAKLATPCTFGAPVVLLICYDKSETRTVPTNHVDMGLVDTAIVASHIMLEARELGLGTCWVCRFDDAIVREQFALSETMEPACFMPLGYGDKEPADRHFSRRPLSETVVRM